MRCMQAAGHRRRRRRRRRAASPCWPGRAAWARPRRASAGRPWRALQGRTRRAKRVRGGERGGGVAVRLQAATRTRPASCKLTDGAAQGHGGGGRHGWVRLGGGRGGLGCRRAAQVPAGSELVALMRFALLCGPLAAGPDRHACGRGASAAQRSAMTTAGRRRPDLAGWQLSPPSQRF